MLRLTAKYADLWNIGYLGQVDTLTKHHQDLLQACRDTGRDPKTLGITVLLHVHYPKMMPLPPGLDYPPLSGTPTQVARALLAYQQAGVEHLMFHLLPYTPAAIRKMEQALHLFHQLSNE